MSVALVASAPAAQPPSGDVGVGAAPEEVASLEGAILERLAAGQDASDLVGAWRALPDTGRTPLPRRHGQAPELRRALTEIEGRLGRLAAKGQHGRQSLAAWRELLAAYDAARAAELILLRRFDSVDERLAARAVGGEGLRRLQEARSQAERTRAELLDPLTRPMTELRKALAAGTEPSPGLERELLEAAAALSVGLEREAAPPSTRVLRASGLPYRSTGFAPRLPTEAPAIQPSYATPFDVPPQAEDLAATPDAPLSAAIVAKAEELGFDYVRIFELVRNEIATEWYAGAMKGAEETLRQRSGNDVDQASLLVALLRAASAPSRYVHGVVELPVARVAESMGVRPGQVPSALARAGIAYRPVVRGGVVTAVEVEHTWVAAWIPYANYRGAVVDLSGSTWIPLAPAVEGVEWREPAGIPEHLGFSAQDFIDAYLSSPQPATPLERLRHEIVAELGPDGGSYEDLLGSRAIGEERLGLLPSSLPFRVVKAVAEEPRLGDAARQRVRFVARAGPGEGDPILFEKTLPVAVLANRRVSFSYLPATVDDHRVVVAFGGLDAVPPYLVRLRPRLQVDGRPVAVGAGDLPMGRLHRLEIELLGPFGRLATNQELIAGAFHSVAIGAQRFRSATPKEEEIPGGEGLAARLLTRVGLGYGERWDAAEEELAELLRVTLVRPLPAVAIVTNEVTVETLFGLPMELRWWGVSLDAALRVAEGFSLDEEPAARRDWMRLSALEGSALEARIFDDLFLVEGISADRGLGLARVAGIEVLEVDLANAAAVVPSLDLPSHVREEIRRWADLGMVIQTPVGEVRLDDWRGAVWRVEEPGNGAGGYFIAGGLAGGATTQDPGSWVLDFLAHALAAPYSTEPQTDSLAAAEVVKIPASDGQEGEVGQVLPTQLAVQVRDAEGRPVLGAPVTFFVASGGGALLDGVANATSEITVPTNALGIASAAFRLGTDTQADPLYRRRLGEEHATRVGANLVEVEVPSRAGMLVLGSPFRAFAFPGPPAALRRTDRIGTIFTGPVGAWADTIQVAVEDQFGNPVSNQAVTFRVTDLALVEDHGCSNPPANPQNAVVFDPRQCPEGQRVLGAGCGEPLLVRSTSPRGTAAGVILGNTYLAAYGVEITSGSLPPLELSYGGFVFTRAPDGTCTLGALSQARIRIEPLAQPINQEGESIHAARTGEASGWPAGANLSFARYAVEVRQNEAGAHFLVELAQLTWEPTTGEVTVSVGHGGSAPLPDLISDGSYVTTVTTGPEPGPNVVELTASEVRYEVPVVDSATGVVSYEQRAWDQPVTRPVATVWGVDPAIVRLRPDVLLLDDDGATLHPVEVDYRVSSLEYRAASAEVDLFAGRDWLALAVGASRSGAGTVGLQRSLHFDSERQHTAELVLNRGGAVEIRSEAVPLPFSQRLFGPLDQDGRILGSGDMVRVSQDVDLVNDRACTEPDAFGFVLTREAEVRLVARPVEGQEIDGTPELGPGQELFRETLPAGRHAVLLTPQDLPPGTYRLVLTGVTVGEGQEETVETSAVSEYRSRDVLPIGHVFAKGVDLWDGHLVLSREDFRIPGRGVTLELRRTYSSGTGAAPGPLGVGWSHSYQSRLVVTRCGEVVVVGGEGSGMRFVDDGAGGLRPLRGHQGTLLADHESFTFDFFSRDGTRYHYGRRFGSEWLLDFIEDTNGNRTRLEYEARAGEAPRLAAARDSSGRSLRFFYRHADFHFWSGEVISRIEGPAGSGIVVSFDFDSHGNLASARREPHGGEEGVPSRHETYRYALPPAHPVEHRHLLIEVRDEVRDAATRYAYGWGAIGLQGEIAVPRAFVDELEEPEGGLTRFVFDVAGLGTGAAELATRVIDPQGHETTYTLNRYGSPLRIEDPEGQVTAMEWDFDQVVMTSRTDGKGARTDWTYDEHGNVLSEAVTVTHFDGSFEEVREERSYWPPESFDPPYVKNRLRTLVDRGGGVAELSWDLRGNLLSRSIEVTDLEGAVEPHTVSHTYLANGDRASSTDARGFTTHFRYDAYGNLIQTTDALGGDHRTAWNVRSLPVRQVDPLGRETLLAYDTLGRLVARTLPRVQGEAAAPAERTVYEDASRRVREIDPLGREVVTTFDRAGRPLEVENPAGGRKLFAYDAAGNKILETTWFDAATPSEEVSFHYDRAGRLLERHEPLGRVTRFAYDGVGNVIEEVIDDITDPAFAPRVTAYAYDALNRRIELARLGDGETARTRIRYDGRGSRVLEEDPLGRLTRWRYDELGRLLEQIEPDWREGEPRVTRWRYDLGGNPIEERVENAPQPRVRRFVYDALDRPVQRTDGEGGETHFEHDAVGNLIREIDPRRHLTSYLYDERNRRIRRAEHLTRVTSPGREVVTTYVYDPVGNLVEERWPNGNVVRHSYDTLDRRAASTDSLGPLGAWDYDARGNTILEVDGNGNQSRHLYDALDRLVESRRPEGRVERHAYDAAGNRVRATDPRGHTTELLYDRLDRLVEVRDPAPLGTGERYTYDLAGNRLTSTDRRGHTRHFVYDALDRLVRRIDPEPLATEVHLAYDALGHQVEEVDRRGIVRRWRFDAEGRLLEEERDGVLLRRLEYDPAGNLRFETDARGNVTGFEYDERNLVVAENRPLAAITRIRLDDMGDRLEVRDPEGRVERFVYDQRRRLVEGIDGAGAPTRYTYDGNDNRTSRQRPEGGTWSYHYDGADRLVAVEDPLGAATAYGYDENGNLVAQQDALGRPTELAYDPLDRRISRRLPDGSEERFELDGTGNVEARIDLLARRTEIDYDALDREIERRLPPPAEPTGDDLVARHTRYDENGNPVEVVELFTGGTGERVTRMAYDRFDRLLARTDAWGKQVSYTYDAAGNRISVRDHDTRRTLYGYDELNRVQSVTVPELGVTEYHYFRDSRLRRVLHPNGLRESHLYDAAGRVEEIEHRLGEASLIGRLAYAYDANGNRIEQVEERPGVEAEVTTYAYDAADRLAEVVYPERAVTYTYDLVGNRTVEEERDSAGSLTSRRVFTYDIRDRLLGIVDELDPESANTFAYDAAGNRTAKATASEELAYLYDTEDRMIEVRRDGLLLETYGYDHRHLRVRKAGPGGTMRYVWDDQSVLAQTDLSGNTLVRYQWGPDRLLALEPSDGERQFYLFDALRSPVTLTTASGAITVRYRWDAWGNLIDQIGDSPNPFGFTGHERDPETGLYYAKARFYDPEVGRFLSQDPWEGVIDTPPSLHKYLYAYQNPTVWWDPDGRIALLTKAAAWLEERANRVRDVAQEDSGEVAVMRGAAAGGLRIGASLVSTLNWAANSALLNVAQESTLGEEARAELKELTDSLRQAARAGVERVVEDPDGTVGLVLDAPNRALSRQLQEFMRALSGDREALAEVTAGAVEWGAALVPFGSAGKIRQGERLLRGRVGAGGEAPRAAGQRAQRSSTSGHAASRGGVEPHPRDADIAVDNYRGRYQAGLRAANEDPLPRSWDVHHTEPQRLLDPSNPQHRLVEGIDIHHPRSTRGVPGYRQPASATVTEPTGRVRVTNPHAEIDLEFSRFLESPNVSRADFDEFRRFMDWRWEFTHWERGAGR